MEWLSVPTPVTETGSASELAFVVVVTPNAAPGDLTVREAVSGNLCRCTGYGRVLAAIERAVSASVAAKAGELVDRETASKHVAAPIFQVRDVASMQKNVEREQAEMLAQAEASAEAGVTGESMRALTGEGTGRGPRPGAEA